MFSAVTRARFPRGDTIIAGLVPLGLSAILAEAYFRSEIPLADPSSECVYSASSQLVQPHHVEELRRRGIVVISGVLSEAVLTASRQDVLQIAQSPEMTGSTNALDVRQDRILWVAEGESASMPEDDVPARSVVNDDVGKDGADRFDITADPLVFGADGIARVSKEPLIHCIRLVRGVTHALMEHGYCSGPCNPTPPSKRTPHYRVPSQCQLAMYPGDGNALYHRHLDTCTTSIAELGLLEWLRLSDYRARSITVILYLNPSDRPATDGGHLRCWTRKMEKHETAQLNNNQMAQNKGKNKDGGGSNPPEDYEDVIPRGGTLVIFESDKIEHMVLPSIADRYALTSWVFRVD